MPPIKVPLSPANTTQVVVNQSPTDRQTFWQTAVDRVLKNPVWDWPVIKQNGVPVLTSLTALNELETPEPDEIVKLNPTEGARQMLINDAPFTIAATAEVGSLMLLIINGQDAGEITFTGFDKQFAGDPLDTVPDHAFVVTIDGFGIKSAYMIKALQ